MTSMWFYGNLGLLLNEQVKKDLLLSHVKATVTSTCGCIVVASPAHTARYLGASVLTVVVEAGLPFLADAEDVHLT